MPREVFYRSIAPQLERSQGFLGSITKGAAHHEDGTAKYQVDLKRFDNFFNHLCWALYFDRYKLPFNDLTHTVSHVYCSLHTTDQHELAIRGMLSGMLDTFRNNYINHISHFEASKATESVYASQIIDPVRQNGSITIIHTFYGIFEVVSLLSQSTVRFNA